MKLYQAGAGSGKTYTITQELVTRLASGSVRPEHILATTFTRKAAAELKDRIQERLLRPEEGDPSLPLAERLALIQRLGESTIGTVHSVGHQLLSRYALRLGLSPRLEPLEEVSQERHLRRILADMPAEGMEEMDRLAGRFGMEDYQDLVLEVLDAKRANAIPDDIFGASMSAGIERYIEIISEGTTLNLPGWEAFFETASEALARLRANDDAAKKTQKAMDTIGTILKRRRPQWEHWGKAAKLDVAVKSKDAVADLVALARQANLHAELHADLRAFNACLVERVLELQGHYKAYKESRGLVDFTDLEERLLAMVRDETIAKDLDLDLVVVDEFQDTNPIQLAIFQQLAKVSKDSLWVGDKKQAIYGFRGTDPALMEAVVSTIPASDRETLPHNWRSLCGLVDVVNKIFEPLFGEGTALTPKRGDGSHVERWALQGKNKDLRREAFAAQMQELVATHRPGDIAVLVRKNDDARDIAALLDQCGIPCLVQTAGLLSTKEGELVLAGLRFVADRGDALAAATIRHLEGDAWFSAAVADRDSVYASARIEALKQLDRRRMTPSAMVAAVSQTLDLASRVAVWGEPAKRLANVDELIRLATRYEEETEQQGKAPTLTGLIFWLENLRNKKEDDLPLPDVDAVQVMTLWKSKGLEWPCVVLFQDGAPPDAHPFRVHVEGGRPDGDPLDGRSIRYWPYPFGRTFMGGFGTDGSGVQDAAKESPEGQALIEAQRQEIKRLLYVGFTRARDTLILAEGAKNSLSLLGNWEECVPEAIACDGVPTGARTAAPTTWFMPAKGPHDHPKRYHSPSGAEPVACEASVTELARDVRPKVKTINWADLGNAVHAYLASVPAIQDLREPLKIRHAKECLRRWDCEGHIEPMRLVEAGKTLRRWSDEPWHV